MQRAMAVRYPVGTQEISSGTGFFLPDLNERLTLPHGVA